jgi:hypothetical protein
MSGMTKESLARIAEKFGSSGDAQISGIEPEMHDVAVGDDIFLAFQPQLAGIPGAGVAV